MATPALAAIARPGRLGPLTLPHRLLMGAMHLALPAEDRRSRLIAFYRERVRGGAALVIVGGAAVLPSGMEPNMPCLTDPRDRDDLAAVAQAIAEEGGMAALQLFHAGRYAHPPEGWECWAPSPVPAPWADRPPRAMDGEDIRQLVAAYAEGARFARAAGFRAVEIMASEGYLLNSFLAPVTNRRRDRYGGSPPKRRRLLLEVLAAVREAAGAELAVIVRLSGADLVPGGSSHAAVLETARAVERAGADAINVGVGWHESRVPTVAASVPRAAFAGFAAAIKRVVAVPVLAANRINRPEVANRLVAQGYVDFVAAARPWLADPAWAAKALDGRWAVLNVCVACNQGCLDRVLARPARPATCLVNPRAGEEAAWPLGPAPTRLRVAVVGGGPAGLMAALVAARRGHQVTLFERERELGGQLRLAALVPGKEEFAELLRYFAEALRESGAVVELGVDPTPAQLADGRFDHVIVATGVRPRVPDLPGAHLPHVLSYPEAFADRPLMGKAVVVVGGGGIGCDVAHHLAVRYRAAEGDRRFWHQHGWSPPVEYPPRLTILSRAARPARRVGPTTRWVLLHALGRLRVTLRTEATAVAVEPAAVVMQTPAGREQVAADWVVLCVGQQENRTLAEALAARGVPHQLVGGARRAEGMSALQATREGMTAAYALEDAGPVAVDRSVRSPTQLGGQGGEER